MVILSKRRIIVTTLCACLTIFTISIANLKNEKTVQTVSLPVSNKVIVLDARSWCSR